MAKNGHHAKAIAFAKYITLGQKIKLPKTYAKTFLQTHNAVVLCKKRLEKTANIRKMRAF